jgi:predicted DNA-binding transcriptional regulator AlpA
MATVKRKRPKAEPPAQIMLRDRDVALMAGVCVATVWNGVKAGWLPKPYRLAPGVTRWSRAEVEAALLGEPHAMEDAAD